MAEKTGQTLVIVLAASVVLVGVCVVLLWPSRGPTDASEPAAKAMLSRLGVQGAETQSARRVEAAPAAAAPIGLPEARPEAVVARPEPVAPAAVVVADPAALAVRSQVVVELDAALAASRQALRNACWKAGGDAAAANFPIEATFGPDGGLLAFSIADDLSAPGVGACLRSQPLALKVAAPGVHATVATRLTLP